MRNSPGISGVLVAAGLLWSAVLPARDNPSLAAYEQGVDQGGAAPGQESLRISRMKVDVLVHGHVADVAVEARLVNADGDTDEARFSLVLPSDAVVTGYALDIEGRMIAGVLMDQPRARNVYEDEVRGTIDPGLAEVTEGNVFKTRVYPVTEEEPRTIRVTFSAPFGTVQGLVLPLQTTRPVEEFSLHVEMDGYRSAPRLSLDGKQVALGRKGSAWTVSKLIRNHPLRSALTISDGQLENPLLVSHHRGDTAFFQISDVAAVQATASPQIGRLRVYWDRSLSRRDDLLQHEIDLLAAYVDSARPQAVDLVTFASDTPDVSAWNSSTGLRSALQGVTYRGGTRYAALGKLPLATADQCLLFTDGLVNVDQEQEFQPDCRLSIIVSAPEAGSLRLGSLAQSTQGQLLRLTAGNRGELLPRLLRAPLAVVNVRDAAGRSVPFRALPARDGAWLVVGELPDNSSELRLSVAGSRKGVTERIYLLDSAHHADVDATAVLWASQRVAALADDPLARTRMTELARAYHVASPTMAFLVLESPGQYVNADIAPPHGFSREWMRRYRQEKRAHAANMAEEKQEHLQFVLEQWQERKAWWDTRFAPSPRAKRAVSAGVAAPPPAPVTSAQDASVTGSAGAEHRESEEFHEVRITGSRIVGPLGMQSNALTALPAVLAAPGKSIELDVEDVLTDRPYLLALSAAPAEQRLRALSEQEKAFGTLPAFYLDASEWFRLKGDVVTSLALLYSALELPLADDETRQIVAFRLQREGQIDRAIAMLERIAATTDFRPQPKRALALALAERGRSSGRAGRGDLERAFGILTQVVLEPASRDFAGIETVALTEANGLIPAIEAVGGSWSLDERLVARLDTDLRIVIEWTADDADIDLWVIEPNGEKVYYGDDTSSSGGQISNDMTDGYGPEEYAIRRAPDGEYQVRIDGYDADRLNPNGNNRVMVRMIRDFARANARETLVDAEISFDHSDEDERGGKLIARMQVGSR